MDSQCLTNLLTEKEALQFDQNGYFVVKNALPQDLIGDLVSATDRADHAERTRMGKGPNERINHFDFIGKDDLFLELLDWHVTFPKVWGILGWNIQLYHSHMTITPPEEPGKSLEQDGLGLGWHQDSGRLNSDFETSPRPRVSLKVAYFLTDTTDPGRGNFYVLPGSHLQDSFPGNNSKLPIEDAIPVCVPPGSAVFFDRRIWHSGSANYWHAPRRVLFYGYSYRWLRPRDDMQVAHYLDRCDPIRKQLLGVSYSGGRGYTSPTDEDVPLKIWIEQHAGKETVIS
ncbi:MAG: phytanoyl-CoA dioxygenase family protein [bacterium]|nr:phytanoyl-CoA dioxygenase family protein [bacterium]